MNPLRKWYVAVPFAGLIYGVIIYFMPEYADFFVITVISFLAADLFSILFVRGGRGIGQIPLLGSKIQPKGYVFLVFSFLF